MSTCIGERKKVTKADEGEKEGRTMGNKGMEGERKGGRKERRDGRGGVRRGGMLPFQ